MSALGMAGMPSGSGSSGGGTVKAVKDAGTAVAKILADLTKIDSLLDRIGRKSNSLGALAKMGGSYTTHGAAGANAWGMPGAPLSNGMSPSLGPSSGAGLVPGPSVPGSYNQGGYVGPGRMRMAFSSGALAEGLTRAGGAAAGFGGRYGSVAALQMLQAQGGRNQTAVAADLIYNRFATYGGGSYSMNNQRNVLGQQFATAFKGGYMSQDDFYGGLTGMINAGMTSSQATAYGKQASQFSRMTGLGLQTSVAMGTTLNTAPNSLRLRNVGIMTRDPKTGAAVGMESVIDQMYARSYAGRKPNADNITAGFVPGGSQYSMFQSLGYSDDEIAAVARIYTAKAKNGGASTASLVKNADKNGLGKSIMSSFADKASSTQNQFNDTFKGRIEGIQTFNSAASMFKDAVDKFYDATGGGRPAGFLGGVAGAGGGGFGGSLAHDATLIALSRGGLGGGGALGGLGRLGMLGRAGLAGGAGLLAGSAARWGSDQILSATGTQNNKWAQVGGDALTGAATGAAIGSFVPGVGTLVGGAVGGVIGAGYGFAKHFADGGIVPGNHNRDNVPIYATPGEVVVPKHIVQMYGGAKSLMSALGFQGRGGGGGHYADGGEVWGSPGQNLVTAHAAGLSFTVNKHIAPKMEAFVNALAGRGYKPHVIQGFNDRNIAGTGRKSNHAFGAAIDIDPSLNPRYGNPKGGKHAIPDWVGALAAQFGLGWGGNYHSSKDYMHFEAMDGPSSPGSHSSGAVGRAVGAVAAVAASISSGSRWGGFGNTGGASRFGGFGTKGAGSSTSAATAAPAAPSSVSGNVALAKRLAASRGWGTGPEWDALYWLWNQESGFNDKASNASGAYGIPQGILQLHPDYAAVAHNGPEAQINWGLKYIAGKYTDPIGAVNHKHATRGQYGNAEGWYAQGAWRTKDETAHLHEGEMVIPSAMATAIRSMMAGGHSIGGKHAAGGGGTGSCKHVELKVYPSTADYDEAIKLARMVKRLLDQDDVMTSARTV